MNHSKIPVTILTGFLGSGKTTLLNRILSENHGKRIAVIENEFGEIGVDNELVIGADEEIFEMNNGCICCTVRGDLIRILNKLTKRKDQLDLILVETTGLANPSPVAQTFLVEPEMKEQFYLDNIITLVDAKYVNMHINDSNECKEQIAFADTILLNKTDLVSKKELDALEIQIKEMNALCTIYRTKHADVDLSKVLDVHAFSLGKKMKFNPSFSNHEHHHDHSHQKDVSSFGLKSIKPLDLSRFNKWISKLLEEKGLDIFRCKGILYTYKNPQRVVFQGVHKHFDARYDRLWKEDEEHKSQLVFIGRNLDKDKIEKNFEKCLL